MDGKMQGETASCSYELKNFWALFFFFLSCRYFSLKVLG